MNWQDQKERIRRFLRDPNANIWSDNLLLRLYNDAQRDLHEKAGQTIAVKTIRVPPLFEASYLYDWEWRYTNNSTGWVYQALRYYDLADYSSSHRWEPEQLTHGGEGESALGDNYTQPWEAWMTGSASPAQLPPVWLPDQFDEIIGIYWDKDPIQAMSKKYVMLEDSTWDYHAGEPQGYYRDSMLENFIYIYPLPSDVDWDDIEEQTSPPGYVSSFDIEVTYYGGENFTIEDSTNEYWHTYPWEENYHTDLGDWIMSEVSTDSFHDRGMDADSPYGIALFDSDADDSQDFGVILDETGSAVASDLGAGTDIIDADGQLLVIYKEFPKDISSEDDESDIPSYMRKYIEYDVLGRAFMANTDGHIPSLADYWEWRKEIGYNAVKIFKVKKIADRDFCFVTQGAPVRNTRKRPRLPDHYPAVY